MALTSQSITATSGRMRTSRVYVENELSVGADISLDKAASHYLRHVLRLKTGAAVVLFNGSDSRDYYCIIDVDGKQARVSIEKSASPNTESTLRSEIIQGLSRSDHNDWMIQKTTELGVNRISLFNAERTQNHLRPARLKKKLAHWQAIAISACEQCGRVIIPAISFYPDLEQAMEACDNDCRVLLDFDGQKFDHPLESNSAKDISILLGPEGGLSEAEISRAKNAGFKPVSLGSRILRVETAAVVALSIALSNVGDI